jgi:hypothetical protein
MPSSEAHIQAALRNQNTIDYLLAGGEQHAAWIVTIAFYKALHIVETVLARQNPALHKNEHLSRNTFLKTEKRFEKIWVHYSILFQASQVSRYLCDNKSQARYLTVADIKAKILDHHLKQITASANKLIGEAVFPTV